MNSQNSKPRVENVQTQMLGIRIALGRPKRADMLGERGTPGVGLCAGAVDHGVQANLGRGTTGCKTSARIRKASEGLGSEAHAPP